MNLLLSLLAVVQGAILLVAARRQDQISSELALHDYDTNVEADAIVKAMLLLTTELHQKPWWSIGSLVSAGRSRSCPLLPMMPW